MAISNGPHLFTIEWELLVGDTLRLGVQPLTEGGVSDSVGVSVEDWRRKLFTLEEVALLSSPRLTSLCWLVSRIEDARPTLE